MYLHSSAYSDQVLRYLMRKPTKQDIERFWNLVTIRGPDECWLWKNKTSGRATFQFHYEYPTAARFAWWITTDIDPGELEVCHSCDNKLCVNPAHLWLGTRQENAQDMIDKGRHRGPFKVGAA